MIRSARSRRGSDPWTCKKPKARDPGRDDGRADTLHLEYRAQMGAAHDEPRCAAAGPLPARISAGDFQEALSALLGKNAPNLSSAVYVWADGVYLQARMEPQAE